MRPYSQNYLPWGQVSRLLEMSSREYLLAHAEQHAPELLLALKEGKPGMLAALRRGSL